MPKFDAFGREIGEDTLSGLGGSDSAPQATPQPLPSESWSDAAAAATFGSPVEDRPAAPPAPPPAAAPQATFTIPGTVPTTAVPGVRRRRGSGLGCLIGLVVLAAIVAGPVIAIVSFVGAADDAIDEVTGVLDGTTTIDSPGGSDPEAPPPPPVGIDGRSMVRPTNFGGALGRVSDEDLGRAVSIRLSPDRAAMQMVKGNKLRPSVTVDHLGGFNLGPVAGGVGAGLPAIALGAIDHRAPSRLVRASVERYGLKEKGINYLVVSPSTEGGHRWIAYFKNGHYIEGDAKGRIVRRIS